MVLGIYYLTYSDDDLADDGCVEARSASASASTRPTRVELALEVKRVGLQEPIEFRFQRRAASDDARARAVQLGRVPRARRARLPTDQGLENFDFVNHTLAKPDTDRFVLASRIAMARTPWRRCSTRSRR